MSHFHYLAAPRRLDNISYGEQKTHIETIEKVGEDQVLINGHIKSSLGTLKDRSLDFLKEELLIYEHEEDAAGIYITPLDFVDYSVSKRFNQEHIHGVSANFGKLIDFGRQTKVDQKCLSSLVEYLKETMHEGENFEFFTSWAGEEDFDLKSELEFNINDPSLTRNLKILDRQYIKFIKADWQAV